MASGDEDGGPAFPVPGIAESTLGMSLRDWFAGQALAGLMAGREPGGSFRDFADDSYSYADAMLEARK